MAKIFIDDGANLTPAAPDMIVISKDGMDWDYLPKTGLKVGGFFSSSPGVPYPFNTKTMLTLESTNVPTIFIELQNVANQPTFSGGTQNDLLTAKDTIANWIP